MNVDFSSRPALINAFTAALVACAAMSAAPVHAVGLVDMMTSSLADPLLAHPPQLKMDMVLPGDAQAMTCDDFPDGAEPFTLQQAVEAALCHHPLVQSAWAGIKLQAAQVGESRAAYLPSITAGISALRQRTEYPETQFLVNSVRTNSSQYVTLTWRLLDFGGRNANRRSADALLAAALASRDAVLQRTMATVVGAYFDAQTAQAARQAKEQAQALALQTLDVAQKREARGAGSSSDTLQAQTALAKAEMESSRALGALEKSMAAVLLAIGWPAQSQQARYLVLSPDDAQSDEAQQQDLTVWLALADRHPALLAARAQLDASREKLNSARAEGLPTIDFTQSQYINGRPTQGLSSTKTNESVVGLTLNIPLFEGFARTYKVHGAQAQIEIREAELHETENQVLADVVKGYAEAVAALRNLASSRRLHSAAQASLDDVRRRYDRGIVDILQMLNVQMALADAGQERIRAQSEWSSARLRLLTNVGTMRTLDVRVGE